ncbi:MAG TPA: cation:proton antiporter, partial [Gaiellaceae bacterium]|nr:cation:proton antiporter [Gaiellaceae bacterium]
ALLLAVILAPTDAALGQAVATSKRLPSRVRQSLNVESGLNDGICVPLFFVVLAVAQAEQTDAGWREAVRLVLEELGYGALAGVAAGAIAAAVVIVAVRRGSIAPSWLQVVPLAAAGLAFGLADPVGGSGFIAAFVGGAFFGGLRKRAGGDVSYLIDETGDLLAAVTFIVFGAVLLAPAVEDATWQIALYAVLSLTLVRMIPVSLALIGTGARRPTVAFLGWFGPRGLASMVFALLLVEEGGLPNDDVILIVTFVAVGLSVFAHGVSAAPLTRRYSDWLGAHPAPGQAPLEEDDPSG